MVTRIFVGNLPWSVDDAALRSYVEVMGLRVVAAKVVIDRETRRSRGFGFVEVEEDGTVAIHALDGTVMDGRTLRVSDAHPRSECSSRDERGGPPRENRRRGNH